MIWLVVFIVCFHYVRSLQVFGACRLDHVCTYERCLRIFILYVFCITIVLLSAFLLSVVCVCVFVCVDVQCFISVFSVPCW